jgi:hypothetical protein
MTFSSMQVKFANRWRNAASSSVRSTLTGSVFRMGKAATTFKPTKVDVGYYLVAPGRKPRVEYGVMTDADLLQVADEYFGTAKK